MKNTLNPQKIIAKLAHLGHHAVEASLSPRYLAARESVGIANTEAAFSIARPMRVATQKSGYFTGPDRTPAFHCFTPNRKAA